MTIQTECCSLTGNESTARMPYTCSPKLVYNVGAPVDIYVEPLGQKSGAKRPARITFKLGGAAGNGAPVPVANHLPTGMVAAQPAGFLSECCQQLALTRGLQPFIIERNGDEGAITVGLPNGRPGAMDLYIQRAGRLTASDLTGAASVAICSAQALINGPMIANSDDLVKFYERIADLAPDAYRAFIPHPSLVGHDTFAAVARTHTYCQMNAAEAQLLDPTTSDVAKHALRLLFLLGEEREFAITNGRNRGYLWADGRWWTVDPPQVQVASDVGAGDVFVTAWVIARHFYKANAKAALNYALRATAAAISGAPIPPF
jgi:sugar/nucleoside kinase (ribokinase family)